MAEQGEGGIAWTDQTWNPVRGCSRVSDGCTNCYAETVAARYSFPATDKRKAGAYLGLAKFNGAGEPRWTGEVRMVPEHLADPIRWTKPRRVFVNSMSDLFHEKLTDREIAAVFGVMALACHHTFQVLTKRAQRMRDTMAKLTLEECIDAICDHPSVGPTKAQSKAIRDALPVGSPFAAGSGAPLWPLPNVWLGVSAENQATADERIPLLLQCPAAVRWVSAEPLLGPIDFRPWLGTECTHEDAYTEPDTNATICRKCDEREVLDWIVVGGESGSGARPCDVDWIRDIVQACRRASVPVFVKQLGAQPLDGEFDREECRVPMRLTSRKGGDVAEWPEDLRVREYPQ